MSGLLASEGFLSAHLRGRFGYCSYRQQTLLSFVKEEWKKRECDNSCMCSFFRKTNTLPQLLWQTDT
jgi:hypothetical protein